jgi:hypothetical protein
MLHILADKMFFVSLVAHSQETLTAKNKKDAFLGGLDVNNGPKNPAKVLLVTHFQGKKSRFNLFEPPQSAQEMMQ